MADNGSGTNKTSCAHAPKKMLWFIGIGGHGQQIAQYKHYVRAAVVSAMHHAPSLVPNLILSDIVNRAAAFNSSGRFEAWFRRVGGIVHRWNLSFYPALQDAVDQVMMTIR